MAPPKPKIPSVEVQEFLVRLGEDAAKLSDSLSARAEPLAEEGYKTLGHMATFNKTKNGKTPYVESPADFSVSLDEMLQGFRKEPQQIEGLGGKTANFADVETYGTAVVNSYDETSGVLYRPENQANYVEPNPYLLPLNVGNDPVEATRIAHHTNAIQTEAQIEAELADRTQPQVFNNSGDRNHPWSYHENIPAIVPPLAVAGAGAIALTAKPSQAATQPQTEPNIPPMLKRPPEVPELLKRPTEGIEAEIHNLANPDPKWFAGASAATNPAKVKYEAEKTALQLRAAENSKAYEAQTGKPMSDIDRALMLDMLQVGEGSPAMAVEGMANLMYDEVMKFKLDVINPVLKTVQGVSLKKDLPLLIMLRDKAPSLAVLAETGLYYHYGSTGWNIGEKKADTDPATLDLVVQKLIQDKTTLIGSDAGAAMLGVVSEYRDFPLWIVGGSSTLGLAAGGMANELVREDGDLAKGAAMGVGFGFAMQKILGSRPAQKVLGWAGDKLSKVKLDPALKVTREAGGEIGAAASDVSNFEHLKNLFTVEPLAIMAPNTVAKLADNAALRADDAVSDLFKTQVVAPQAIVLDVTEDGAPKIFGVKNGQYGELPEGFKNPEGRPVIITQQAKRVWIDNTTLRDNYQRMIGNAKPANRSHGIDEWTDDVIPPDDPGLMFAWKKAGDGEGMVELYRTGSHQFTSDLLRSRSLVEVDYQDANGVMQCGLGYYSYSGVVLAPDVAENIPNAIPRDLVMMRHSLSKTNRAPPMDPSIQAWEIRPVTDQTTLFEIVDHIKGQNDLNVAQQASAARGGNFADGITAKPEPAPFDNIGTTTRADKPSLLGGAMPAAAALAGDFAGLTPTQMGFLFFATVSKQEIARSIMKIPVVSKVAAQWLPATAYGEVFKIDAAIQAFSTRHLKRYLPDMTKQLVAEFGNTMNDPIIRQRLSDEIRSYVTGRRIGAPPPTLAPALQSRVNMFMNERNMDFARIAALGGVVPKKSIMQRAPDMEMLFARDYVSDTEWVKHLEKTRAVSNTEKAMIGLTKNSQIGKAARGVHGDLFGKQKIEVEMANDYFDRKFQLNTLNLCAELSANPQAASAMPNTALGHIKKVDFRDAGVLTGKYVSEDTYNAIHRFPEEQKMMKGMWMNLVDKVKYNKTVLNPAVWAKNIAGNVYGVMNSNIVPTHSMMWEMPSGIRQMNRDLAAYSADMTSNSPAVQRVHETLKFGLLGADFESTRSKLGEVLQTLEHPMKKAWDERVADVFYKAKDSTLTALGQKYSHIDTATKYALYVQGLKRWGIDMSTNTLSFTNGRVLAANLLGFDAIANLSDGQVAELVKRAVVRRIHLSLPMVDRASPLTTKLSKYSGMLTNPWLRTSLELARVTSQMPYRFVNEPGYAVNMAKTAGILGALYAFNRWQRIEDGVSDRAVDDAMAIAPDDVKKYMSGPVATKLRASDGGLIVADMGDMLVESMQWFTDSSDKGQQDPKSIPHRVLVKLLDTITGGSVVDNEAKDILSKVNLAPVDQKFNTPAWKQDDWSRGLIDLATRFGPQFINNGWNLYNTTLPVGMANKHEERLQQPREILVAKSLGLDVASIGTEQQKNFKLTQIRMKRKELRAQIKSAGRQVEGSSTGKFQDTFEYKVVVKKLEMELDKLDQQELDLVKRVSITQRDAHRRKIKLTK